MAKEISITYSINVFFEKRFNVDDDFVLTNGIDLKGAFEEITEKFSEQDLKDLDETNCNCSPEYYGQDPFELDSIEITNLENPVSEVQFIGK